MPLPKNSTVTLSTAIAGITLLTTHFAYAAAGNVTLENPLAVNSPAEFIGLVINAFLGLSGSIALVVFVYGGILWMTSAGDKGKVTKGMDTMIWAAIGMAVIFASAAIVRFLLTALLGK